MKKQILIAVIASTLLIAVPAFAAPAENANPSAFQAQHIKICREMMKDAVAANTMTKEQAKECVQMMKTSSCAGMEASAN